MFERSEGNCEIKNRNKEEEEKMIPALLLVVAGFLLVASIIDWKLRVLPSIFLTGMLFVVAFVNPQNLWFGIMAFIIAYLLYEAEFFSGWADIKIMAIIGFMISSEIYLLGFILLTVTFGTIWKILIKWRLKTETDVAFVPVLLFVYITLYFLGAFT